MRARSRSSCGGGLVVDEPGQNLTGVGRWCATVVGEPCGQAVTERRVRVDLSGLGPVGLTQQVGPGLKYALALHSQTEGLGGSCQVRVSFS